MNVVQAAKLISEIPGWRLEAVRCYDNDDGDQWSVDAACYPKREVQPDEAEGPRYRTRDAEIEVRVELAGAPFESVVNRVVAQVKALTDES